MWRWEGVTSFAHAAVTAENRCGAIPVGSMRTPQRLHSSRNPRTPVSGHSDTSSSYFPSEAKEWIQTHAPGWVLNYIQTFMNGTRARSKIRKSETRRNGARGCGFGCCASVLQGGHGWCARRSDKPEQTVCVKTSRTSLRWKRRSTASQNRNRTRRQTGATGGTSPLTCLPGSSAAALSWRGAGGRRLKSHLWAAGRKPTEHRQGGAPREAPDQHNPISGWCFQR